jgi:hypothetical protein
MKTNKYIFVTDEGDYVAVDSASGGYPYRTDNFFQAHLFCRVEEAERYYAVMSASVDPDDKDTYSRVTTWKLMEIGDIDVALTEISFDKTRCHVIS